MAFAKPEFKKGEINRAGEILCGRRASTGEERAWAWSVLANYRACHAYPINTFQALLRLKLKTIDGDAIVAQRLKRAPSIILKLQRFEEMNLARMQDIGGLRAVVSSPARVRRLESAYRNASFKHKLVSSKDYIANPKPDGYRSIHLIYRYFNPRAPDYEGLSIELQLRTRLQHAWATAVETMGTFLGQALKSGQGERNWRDFFSAASAAIAIVEKSSPVPGYERLAPAHVFKQVAAEEKKLHVLDKLNGFAIAADRILKQSGQGAYHLVVLDSGARTVSIRPFSLARLDEANRAYAEIESRANAGEPVEAVLVSAGPVDALRKAYPNYFLDTQAFVAQIQRVIKDVAAEA
jgi:putative GTP pyrophosphokinase